VIRLHAALLATSKMAKRVKKESAEASAIAVAASKAAAAAESACCDARSSDAASAAAAASAAVAADRAAVEPVYRGWQELLRAAQAEAWTTNSPVPARYFTG
jgi:hypothetical protein